MTPYYQDDAVTLWHGDCLDILRELPDASVDAVCTDPPYALEFMGRTWDGWSTPAAFQEWCTQWATECLRVLKPGGHMLVFGGSRTWHRLASAVEDAGFEIRDSIAWLYGSGFPKSLNVSKAIDQARGDREDILRVTGWLAEQRDRAGVTNRQIDDAFGFNGMAGHWTAAPHLKVAQVPRWEQWERLRELIGFGDEMDAEVQRIGRRKGEHGEAWQNAEVLRTETRSNAPSGLVSIGQGSRNTECTREIKAPNSAAAKKWQGWGTALKPAFEPIVVGRKPLDGTAAGNVLAHGTGALNIDGCRVGDLGKWPTNVVLDESQADALGDESRYFPTFRYEAKAPTAERPRVDGVAHPTVKPLDLMRWLVRLACPPGGTVLEPFAGSGTTAEACVLEGVHCIAIEREADYLPLITQRLAKPLQLGLDLGEVS